MSGGAMFGVEYGQPHMVGRLRSASTYNSGCRCDDCREAKRIDQRRATAKRTAISRNGHPAGRAVSKTTYTNWGCRCDGCTADHCAYLARSGANRRWLERQKRKAAS